VNVVVVRPGAIDTEWRHIAGANLLERSGNGPYAKATKAMHAKFLGTDFDKLVANPSVIADVVQQILKTSRPKSVYTAPRMARNMVLVTSLLGTDRLRDAFTRRFIGLPKAT
jgi:hypothetical protein